jgi:hypothetical protein
VAYSELDVIKKIRESNDPERALRLVMEITGSYLIQTEASRSERPSAPEEISA